jgi:hypothetical protein
MKTPSCPRHPAGALRTLQRRFLTLLPKIELHGRIYFRYVKCPIQREEVIAEMVGLCWQWFLSLARRGKDATRFPSALASFAARAVQSGRRLAGMERPRDVLSGRAQREHAFVVEKLPDCSTLSTNLLTEALIDNTQTPVPDQVAFRSDFPAWRLTRTERDRRVVDDLMRGERTLDVSRKYGLSPARISQLRREFHDDWSRFTADPAEADTPILV